MSSKITLSSWLHKKKKREAKTKFKVFGSHEEFLTRINKTLYYGKLPKTDRFSLPVTELAAEIFSKARFPENGVHLRLRPEGKMLGLERLSVGDAGDISRAACISPCSLVLALIYVDRLRECNPKYLEKTSPSKLFVVSLMVASKFLHDDGEDDEVFNDEWAASSGINEVELNVAEREFLSAIDWRVNVREPQFWEWLEAMEESVAFREGRRKGWFSYSDLNYLLQSKELRNIANTLLTVSAVCLTSYTAGVLTLLGSTIIVSSLPSPASLILHSMHQTTLLTPKTPQDPPQMSLKEKLEMLPESCLEESVIQAASDCPIRMLNDFESHIPYQDSNDFQKEDKDNSSVFDFLSLVSLSKVDFPGVKSVTSFFNCVTVVSRVFDSFFSSDGNLCSGLLSESSMQQESFLDYCIHLLSKHWVASENVSQSFQMFDYDWNLGTSFGLDDKIGFSPGLTNPEKCVQGGVCHSSVPLEASQY